MKTAKLMIVLLLLGAGGVGNAWADRHGHHGDVRFGVMIGPYWGGPWPYPSPYYYPPYYAPYYPPVVVERPVPQVYIEQPAASAEPPPAPVAAAPPNYWYYCAAAKGYYPYVKECPRGWQKVSPQPTGQR